MRVERALLEELPEKKFNIGYQGEQNHTQVIISCPIMFRDYPDAVASMVVKPPQGDLYPVSLTRDGNDLTWDVSDADVAIPGEGILQLTFTDGEGEEAEIIKTVYGSYSVNASLVADGEAPDPVQSWLDEAGAALATFENEIGDIRKITTATEEDEGLALSPKTVVNGKVTEWEYIDLADPEVVTQAIDDWLDDHPEATTTVQDGAITEAKLNSTLKDDLAWKDDVDGLMSAIEQKANVDGYYEDLTAGNAEQLVGTVGVADSVPYNFRTTGGSADVGDRLKESAIVGGTVAWNQLMKDPSLATNADATKANTSVSDRVMTVTADGTGNAYVMLGTTLPSSADHAILLSCDVKLDPGNSGSYATTTIMTSWSSGSKAIPNATPGTWKTISTVVKPTAAPTAFAVYPFRELATDAGEIAYIRNPIYIDLTQMFGSTIADYLYTLETATPGAGVAWFRKLFPKAYYAYNAGSLESVSTSKHREIGFNQWDGETEEGYIYNGNLYNDSTYWRSKNYIHVVPGATYYFNLYGGCQINCYDASKQYNGAIDGIGGSVKTATIPDNCHYIKFYQAASVDKNTVCINLHWDGERDGEYEAYKVREYDLPNVVLRGIPKLDASNNLYYDGDVLTPDGTVTRKYGIVDLGTLSWEKLEHQALGTYFYAGIASLGVKYEGAFGSTVYNALCSIYKVTNRSVNVFVDNTFCFDGTIDQGKVTQIQIKNSAYSDAASFKTAMSGIYLVYELDTPTTESVDPWQETQIVNDFGTEEYVDRLATAAVSPRDVSIPVGHISTYQSNLRAKLEMSPDSPDGDGLYIVKQTSGQNEYVAYVPELPTNPNDNGTYTLKVTVSGSTKTLAWVADT